MRRCLGWRDPLTCSRIGFRGSCRRTDSLLSRRLTLFGFGAQGFPASLVPLLPLLSVAVVGGRAGIPDVLGWLLLLPRRLSRPAFAHRGLLPRLRLKRHCVQTSSCPHANYEEGGNDHIRRGHPARRWVSRRCSAQQQSQDWRQCAELFLTYTNTKSHRLPIAIAIAES